MTMQVVVPLTPTVEASKHEQAWSHLFQSLTIIAEEARKPGFNRVAFHDAADGRVWSMPALLREVEKRLSLISTAGKKPL